MANPGPTGPKDARQEPLQASSPLHYVGYGTDQERKALLERLGEGFLSVDANWHITYLNHQAEVILGKTPQELLNRNLCEVFPTSADSVFSLKAHESRDQGMSLTFLDFHPLLQKWLLVRLYPFEKQIYLFFQDITHQAMSSFERKREGNENTSVIVTNLQGKIIYWNQGAQAIFGYRAEEMLGQTPARLYPQQQDARRELRHDLQQIRQGEDYRDLWKGQRKDGSTVWIAIETTLLSDREGKAIGFIGIAHELPPASKGQQIEP